MANPRTSGDDVDTQDIHLGTLTPLTQSRLASPLPTPETGGMRKDAFPILLLRTTDESLRRLCYAF